ncbi:hypothetical protein, partial [Pseudoflavonifractor capillosus]|uniref:hypothetical protein n=1 Tax=Pseudoflavonifractor capillosus TaxID=106588 RepID=UPI00195828D7
MDGNHNAKIAHCHQRKRPKEIGPGANDNSLIIVVKSAGYSLHCSVLCVADKEAAHMNDYMK